MSFILESIKQAERERKLGEVPSITVEYVTPQSNEYIENWKNWAIISLGMILIFLCIWIAISTFRNYQEMKILSMNTSSADVLEEDKLTVSNKNNFSVEKENNEKLNYLTNNVIHDSQLKSINLIEEDSIVPKNSVYEESEKEIISEKIESKIQNDEDINELQIDLASNQNRLEDNKRAVITHDSNSSRDGLVALFSEITEQSDENYSVEYVEFDDKNNNFDLNERQISAITQFETSQDLEVDNINKEIKAINSGVTDFGQLPYVVQEQIPEIQVSVHMFHEDPMQRRIRINGRMHTEGASLQSGLLLKEITQYGAIFEFQDHKFRMNLR